MTTQRYRKVFLTFLLTLVWTAKLLACNCEGEGTVSMGIRYSDVVFSGQVISRTLTKNYDNLGVTVIGDTSKISFKWREFPTAVVKIKVEKMYKGQLVSDTLTILTPPNGANCGYYFQVGQKYIVYATIFDQMLMTHKLKRRTFDNRTFWTHQCTRTNRWNSTEEKEILKVKK